MLYYCQKADGKNIPIHNSLVEEYICTILSCRIKNSLKSLYDPGGVGLK